MSDAATNGDEDTDIVTVNFKTTQTFLDEIDETWQGRGFNSRSEFIRYTLRDAVEFPTFDRDELDALSPAEPDRILEKLDAIVDEHGVTRRTTANRYRTVRIGRFGSVSFDVPSRSAATSRYSLSPEPSAVAARTPLTTTDYSTWTRQVNRLSAT
nr:ribbon-helix-helix domain-containing protein [Salarchaeum sp. JOR-1]